MFIVVPAASAEFTYSGGLIDIPEATPPRETYVSFAPSGSFALGDDPHSFVSDLNVSLSVAGRGEISLSVYTIENYSLNTRLTVLPGNETTPAVAVGMDNITYREWTSSVGDGSSVGFQDDLGYAEKRPREAFSFFVVATKTVENLPLPFRATAGIGRGKYVGKGPLSQYTNSDIFFDSDNTLAVGLFGGIAVNLAPSVSAMLEYDGRDANIGLQYDHGHVSLKLAFTHVEQLRSSGEIGPRVALGLALNSTTLTGQRKGHIAGRVFDAYSGDPVSATITIPGVREDGLETDGAYRIAVRPGSYRLQVASEGYFAKQFKVAVRPDDRTELSVPLLHIVRSESLSLHLDTADRLLEEGKIRSARDEYAAVLRIYPDHETAHTRLREIEEQVDQLLSLHRSRALQYQEAGMLQESLSEWSEFLKLKPEDMEATDAIENLRVTIQQKQIEKKSPTPKKKSPAPPPERRAEEPPKLTTEEVEILYDQALIHYFNEEYEEALDLLKRILKDYPNHQKAKKYLDRTARILGL
jgi:hypothetical protein